MQAMKTLLMVLFSFSLALTAYADESIKSTAKARGEASSNNAATVSAKSQANSKCREKNQQAVCRAKGHKPGSKGMQACKKDLKKKGKYQSSQVSKKCHKTKLTIVCNLKISCWYK